MISKTDYNFKKRKLDRKIQSEVYILFPPYITEKLPIETLSEMIDCSVKSLGEVDYDNENCLRYQKILVRPLVVNHGKVPKISWSRLERNFAT